MKFPTNADIRKMLADTLPGKNMTFRNKIIVSAILVLTLASFVYTFVAVRTENAIMRDEIIEKAEVVTELASQLGELPLISGNPELVKKAVTSLKNVSDVSFVAFYDRNMTLLAKEGEVPHKVHNASGCREMSIVEEDDYFDLCSPIFTFKSVEDIDVFHEAAGNRSVKENVGWVRIGFSRASMKEARDRIIYRGMAIAVVFTFVNIIFVYKLFTIATRPLTALSSAVKSVSRGKYPEIPVTSGDEIGLLTSEFNRMSSAISEREESLRESETKYRIVADYSYDWEFWRLEDNSFKYMSPSSKEVTGYAAEEFYADPDLLARLIHPDDLPIWTEHIHKLSPTGEPTPIKLRIITKDGDVRWIAHVCRHVFDNYGKPYGWRSSNVDITERRNAEEEIKASLREKEVLLREIHHRVKNNMQIVLSMLRLQSQMVKDKSYIGILNDSQNRIQSMSLIHEKLYQSADLAHINFSNYVNDLITAIFRSYGTDAGRITRRVETGDIFLGIDTAVPCGLIINELVSNALKHAFPEERRGEIVISIARINEDEFELKVGNNGVSIPEDIDFRSTESMGLGLVTILAENQLRGTIELDRTKGTEFSIRFKEVKYAERV
ncbi:MAG: histidine kinase dimerization/phosphoacceptor domain -containing protein [Nitrospirota bacterium]